jgi:hypothetical protein
MEGYTSTTDDRLAVHGASELPLTASSSPSTREDRLHADRDRMTEIGAVTSPAARRETFNTFVDPDAIPAEITPYRTATRTSPARRRGERAARVPPSARAADHRAQRDFDTSSCRGAKRCGIPSSGLLDTRVLAQTILPHLRTTA